MEEQPVGFLKDPSGDWSSSRLISISLGIAVVGMAAIIVALAVVSMQLARDCVPVPQGPQCTRDPNIATIITALGTMQQMISMSLVPMGLMIVGVMWKRDSA